MMLCQQEATLIRSKDLKAFDLFADLDLSHIEMIRPFCEERDYLATDSVFVDGDEARHIYLVQKGRISLRMKSRPNEMVEVFSVTPGLFCGWSALVPPYIMTSHGEAMEATKAILVNGSDLRRICKSEPEIGHRVMRAVAKAMRGRLSAARSRLINLVYWVREDTAAQKET
jgi:CRP-like cAMP-binding protein